MILPKMPTNFKTVSQCVRFDREKKTTAPSTCSTSIANKVSPSTRYLQVIFNKGNLDKYRQLLVPAWSDIDDDNNMAIANRRQSLKALSYPCTYQNIACDVRNLRGRFLRLWSIEVRTRNSILKKSFRNLNKQKVPDAGNRA